MGKAIFFRATGLLLAFLIGTGGTTLFNSVTKSPTSPPVSAELAYVAPAAKRPVVTNALKVNSKFLPTMEQWNIGCSNVTENGCSMAFQTLNSSNQFEIYLSGSFSTLESAQYYFNSNIEPWQGRQVVIKPGDKFNAQGIKVGERVVVEFASNKYRPGRTRITWTDGNAFWYLEAPTTEMALEFEQSGWLEAISQQAAAKRVCHQYQTTSELCVAHFDTNPTANKE